MNRALFLLAGLGLAVANAGCSTELIVPDGLVHPDCETQAFLEIVPLDIWGRSVNGATVQGNQAGALQALSKESPQTFKLAIPGFVDTEVQVTWSGAMTADALTATATAGARVATALDVLLVDGKGCRAFGVFVGLDHPIFAAGGRPPRSGNAARLLMDGQEKWQAVYEDLTDPDRTPVRTHQSTWWWMSNFELHRPANHATLSAETRRQYTMLSLLEQRGGPNRLLIARFAAGLAPGMAYLNTDPALREHARAKDNFEVISQGNKTDVPLQGPYEVPARPFSFVERVRQNPAHHWRHFYQGLEGTVQGALTSAEVGSFHQKALVIDDDIAYVSGMNVKSTDWDTHDHLLYDNRRMRFGATAQERALVAAHKALPDLGPRKDYAIRVQGPAARDVDDVLRVRWQHALNTGAMYSENATPYELLPPGAPAGDVTVQVIATMPEPIQERAILETHLKAIRHAQDLIYIEDQYWRAPVLLDALHEAMDRSQTLQLLVVTKPVSLADGGTKYTVVMDQDLLERYPDRYHRLQLKAFGRSSDGTPEFANMDVHSKIMIIDQSYLSVGSANKNNRGYLYEGELDIAVLDTPFVTEARDRILTNLVTDAHKSEVVGRSGAEIVQALLGLAAANAAVEDTLDNDPTAPDTPTGFVFPLELGTTWLVDVGPDAF